MASCCLWPGGLSIPCCPSQPDARFADGPLVTPWSVQPCGGRNRPRPFLGEGCLSGDLISHLQLTPPPWFAPGKGPKAGRGQRGRLSAHLGSVGRPGGVCTPLEVGGQAPPLHPELWVGITWWRGPGGPRPGPGGLAALSPPLPSRLPSPGRAFSGGAWPRSAGEESGAQRGPGTCSRSHGSEGGPSPRAPFFPTVPAGTFSLKTPLQATGP